MMSETREAERAYPTAEARWQAVVSRDAAADGVFFYAVRSTGIYCRPTCPSKRPNRSNVLFFGSLEGAEGAGFRPCLRCRPGEVARQQAVVAQVQRLLEAGEESGEPTPGLAELGRAVGMSPSHLQRVFKRAVGMSPRDYAAARRAERLKAGLKGGASVTRALYDAGYPSSRALYGQDPLGMSPGAYRRGGAGERVAYVLGDSPLGRMLVAVTARGLCALRFGEDGPLVEELEAEFPMATLVQDDQAVAPYRQAVLDYLASAARPLELPLDLRATDFQRRVWDALRAIPPGETRSYRAVAEMIGEPNAARAVAQACASNPVALFIPCHRVVRSSGELSGYRWGVGRKRELLERERRTARAAAESKAGS